MKSLFNISQQYVSNSWNILQDFVSIPQRQTRLIMFIVCIALLLDNMLYMVIVSIKTFKE